MYKRRLLQKQMIATRHGVECNNSLYCSRQCAQQGVKEKYGSPRSRKTFKRRDWMDDQTWEWEQRLQQMGLGMQRGINHQLISYGEKITAIADLQFNGVKIRDRRMRDFSVSE